MNDYPLQRKPGVEYLCRRQYYLEIRRRFRQRRVGRSAQPCVAGIDRCDPGAVRRREQTREYPVHFQERT